MLGLLARGMVVAMALAPLAAAGWLSWMTCQAQVDPTGLSPGCIVPPAPMLPAYPFLRAVPFDLALPLTDGVTLDAKALSYLALGAAFMAPFALAFFTWRRLSALVWAAFVALCAAWLVGLGWLGAQAPEGGARLGGHIGALGWLALFWVVFPLLPRRR